MGSCIRLRHCVLSKAVLLNFDAKTRVVMLGRSEMTNPREKARKNTQTKMFLPLEKRICRHMERSARGRGMAIALPFFSRTCAGFEEIWDFGPLPGLLKFLNLNSSLLPLPLCGPQVKHQLHHSTTGIFFTNRKHGRVCKTFPTIAKEIYTTSKVIIFTA